MVNHIIPLNDCEDHFLDETCNCKPMVEIVNNPSDVALRTNQLTRTLISHQAFDGRSEMGDALPGKTWIVIPYQDLDPEGDHELFIAPNGDIWCGSCSEMNMQLVDR